jgi:thiol:disulfide interchange protein
MISFGQVTASALFLVGLLATGFTQAHPIYSENADVKAEIHEALLEAKRSHKRIILDFGGNWCGDCKALDARFHEEPNASLLKAHFILIDVNIGRMDLNTDVAKQYQVPLDKGVPALAVLDADGNVLYSQKHGEFEAMRTMDPSSVTTFLEHWKG